MTLQANSLNALNQLEINRLGQRLATQEQRAARSQYRAQLTGWDASQGHGRFTTVDGTVYASSITTGSAELLALSIPPNTVGSADARPVS